MFTRATGNLNHLKLQCLIVRDMFYGREMKREHNCFCLFGRAMAIAYLRVNEQHLECLFIVLFVSHYFSNGTGILGLPKQALNILLLK